MTVSLTCTTAMPDPSASKQLTPGRICYSGTGDDHVARTTPQARILVVERHGRT